MNASARTLIACLVVAGVGLTLRPAPMVARVQRPPPPASLEHPAIYTAGGPFATPIPDEPDLHPNNDIMVAQMARVARRHSFSLALRRWSVTVFTADDATPRHDVRLSARWAPQRWIRDVPIPDHAIQDRSWDGEMVILDLVNRVEYDFWRAKRRRRGRWRAAWANSISMDGNGIFPEGYSARGSGFALLQGIIWPDELEAGRIPHALIFSYKFPARGGFVAPATETDGISRRAYALKEGARVQLDPDLDLDTLGLAPHERTIALALQEFGMFLCDFGGGIELEAVNPASVSGEMYDGLLPEFRHYVDLTAIPVDRFRVLAYPE